jgi:N-acetylglutamate synthase-like GNAT family acetyltransferase
MGANLGHGPWDDDLRDVEQAYLDSGDFLVGEIDGRVVAMGGVREVEQGVGEVKRLRVEEQLQGRGFGEAMARALEQRGRELSFERLVADTTAKQQPAQRLLAKLGFVETHRKFVRELEIIFYTRELT